MKIRTCFVIFFKVLFIKRAIALISELDLDTKKIMINFRYESVSPVIERVFENMKKKVLQKQAKKAMNEATKNGPEINAKLLI